MGDSRKACFHADVHATPSVPPEYLLRRGRDVLKGREHSSRPMEREVAGDTENVQRWIAVCS